MSKFNMILLAFTLLSMQIMMNTYATGLGDLMRHKNRFLQNGGEGKQFIYSQLLIDQNNQTSASSQNSDNNPGSSSGLNSQNQALPANVSDTNLTSLQDKIAQQYKNIFYYDLRIEGLIITDKVIYRPDDVMFIEVVVVDAFNKSLVNLDKFQQYYYQLMFTMEIHDGADKKIFSSSAEIMNSTIGFTFKIPTDQAGGQYKIIVYNQNMPTSERLVNIQSYNRQQLLAHATFDKESYSPGDHAQGKLQVNRTDGIDFIRSDDLSFSYSVEFGVSSFNNSDQNIDWKTGLGEFKFDIPSTITQLVNTIAFTVKFNDLQQIYSTTIIVGQPEKIVIDFATETNQYVYNVENKIYFQAYTGQERSDIVDFSGASLKSEVLLPPTYYDYSTFSTYNYYTMPPSNFNRTNDTVIKGKVSTEHRGKGMFMFTPKPFYSYYLEIPMGNDTAIVDLPFYSTYSYPIPIDPYPMPTPLPTQPGIGNAAAAAKGDVAPVANAAPVANDTPVANDDAVGAIHIVIGSKPAQVPKNEQLDLVAPNLNDTTSSTYIPESQQKYIYPPIYSNPNEISFTILNRDKVLENDEALQLQFMTNQILNYLMNYIVVIQMKEKIVYAQAINFQALKNYKLTVPASAFPAVNGGVFQVSLYLANNLLYNFINNGDLSTLFNQKDFTLSLINPLFFNKGEILFFKKPSRFWEVEIEVDKDRYEPGDKVSFTVSISDKNNSIGNSMMSAEDIFVSFYATDDSVFDQAKQSQLPGSLPTLVYLETEVDKSMSQFFLYANEYLNHLYDDANAYKSSDRNLELLLGIQSWRFGYFFYPNLLDLRSSIYSMSEENQTVIQSLFAYAFVPKQNDAIRGGDGGIMGELIPMQLDILTKGIFTAGIIAGGGAAADSATTSGSTGSTGSSTSSSSGTKTQSTGELTFDPNSIISDFMQNITQNARNYSHKLRAGYQQGSLVDMTETVFYQTAAHVQASRSNLQYKGSFYLSDLITQFRLTANVFSSSGIFGFKTFNIQSTDDFYIQCSLPVSMVVDDSLQIPVTIFNNLDEDLVMSGIINYVYDQTHFTVWVEQNNNAKLQAGELETIIVNVSAKMAVENTPIVFWVSAKSDSGKEYNTTLTKFVNIIPKGFPISMNQGGFIGMGLGLRNVSKKADFLVTIPDSLEEGSIKIKAKVFSSNFATLTEAIAALIKEPYGCFEQLSATTYPLAMGLNFFKSQSDITPEIQGYIDQSTSTLQNGYTKLTDYKTTENGYEWFGQSPASEVLTAYGIQQFVDMSKNTDFVSSNMLDQATSWLMSRVDPTGGFQLNPQALDSFGRAPKNVTDAYIIYALTSTGRTIPGLDAQIKYIVDYADKTIDEQNIDTYYLALVSAILCNVNRTSDARKYSDITKQFQDGIGRVTNSYFTITMSEGKNLNIETTALATIAWLNDQDRYSDQIDKAIEYIVSLVELGSYGTTQATILSLKAITTYMNQYVAINGDGDFVLYVNGDEAQRQHFTKEKKDAIAFDLKDYIVQNQDIFQAGDKLNISLAIDNYTQDTSIENVLDNEQTLGFKLSYSMQMEYYDERPPSGNASLGFSITMNQSELLGDESKIGEIFSYDLEVSNKRANKALLMVVARFRIPSCLEVNFQMLNDLKSNMIIDYYEVLHGNTEIALYWRQLQQGESKKLSLSFVQAFIGECYQQPSDAYVYYNNDQPIYWIYY